MLDTLEEDKLTKNRYFRFTKILGEEWPKEDLLVLMDSSVDYHDFEDLVEKGCPKDLAIKILL